MFLMSFISVGLCDGRLVGLRLGGDIVLILSEVEAFTGEGEAGGLLAKFLGMTLWNADLESDERELGDRVGWDCDERELENGDGPYGENRCCFNRSIMLIEPAELRLAYAVARKGFCWAANANWALIRTGLIPEKPAEVGGKLGGTVENPAP